MSFNILTPILYVLITVNWLLIFIFYIDRIKTERKKDKILVTLFAVLSLDSLRNFLENLYFGIRQFSLSEILPPEIALILNRADISFIPKLLNLIVSFTIIFVLIKRWIPLETEKNRKYKDIVKNQDLLLRQLPESVVITDTRGTIEYVNSYFTEITGYTPSEVLGKNPRILKGGDDGTTDYMALWTTLLSGQVWKGEFYNRKKSGEYYWESAIIAPLKDEDGQLKNFMAIKRDITKRKEIENQYRKMIAAINQSHDSIEILDAEGRFDFVNEAFTKTTGYTASEIIGSYPNDLFSGGNEINKETLELAWSKLSRGESWTGRFKNKIKDGSFIYEDVSISPIFDDEGFICNYASVKRDVTEKILRDEEQKKIKDQLNQSQKMDAIGQLAGGIAHDFNNILSGISAASALLQRKKAFDEELSGRYLGIIDKSTDRAAELTDKLLKLSRRGDDKKSLINIMEVLEDIHIILLNTLDKRIELQVNRGDYASLIDANKSEIHSVLLNIAINASHAIEGNGIITIESDKIQLSPSDTDYEAFSLEPGLYQRVVISDTGCGISEENLERIFEPFFTTKEDIGTGLGLANSMRIIKDHKGAIRVDSKAGEGSAFTVLFPIAGTDRNLRRSSEPADSTGEETILFVDDEEQIRELCQDFLESLGYTVLLASNGFEAVETYREQSQDIDMVVLDVIMPKMNGMEAYFILHDLNPSEKFLITSGYNENQDLKDLLESGFKHYLPKPYSVSQLSRSIRNTLDEDKS